jgi:hypothetical protein
MFSTLGSPGNLAAVAAIAFLLLAQGTAGANLAGSDDFNDNSKDLSKWGADYGGTGLNNSATFNEVNQRLEYTAAGPSRLIRPWILNRGSYQEDWSVQLDTAITALAGTGNSMGLALEIQKAGDPSLRMGILHESAQQARDFYSFQLGPLDPGSYTGEGEVQAFSLGALRVAFDAGDKVLSTYYDVDGSANGYAWTLAAAYGIKAWEMTNSDEFVVLLAGDTSRSVGPGVVYADNFAAVPEPSSVALMVAVGLAFGCKRRR